MTDAALSDEPAETVAYTDPAPDIVAGDVVETYPGDPDVPAVIPGVDRSEVDAAIAAVAGMSPTGGTRRAVEHLARALTPPTQETTP